MSFFANLNEDGEYILTTGGYTVLVLILIAVLILGSAIFARNRKFNPKQLAFSAMAIALATILSFVKLFHMPMGGSVTLLSMLFVTLVGYWFGLGAGLTAAIAYGFLQLVLGPYIISFPQMLTDYVLAFGALGLSGIFRGKKHGLLLGYLTGVAGRFVFSVLSGVIFFGAYAPEEFPNPLVYSAAYNGAYLGVEALITVIVILIPPVANALKRVGQFAADEN